MKMRPFQIERFFARYEFSARNKHIIEENMRLLASFFATYHHLLNWIVPKAGSIAFPSIRFEQDIEQFCTDLVQKQGVLLLPGTCYDFGHKHFRIGFGRKNMPECLGRLEVYLKNELPATRYPK